MKNIKNIKNIKKYALISVYDKKNLLEICRAFKKYNINIISTGSTSKKIISLGYKCQLVSNLTKFKDILDGRVKTLHPKIHSSLLFDRSNNKHNKVFAKLKFPIIDFVIVNLYPFKKTIKKQDDFQNSLEMIDIGGPALLRSSAKNFQSVTTICETKDYKNFIEHLDNNKGETSLKFRQKMAGKIFSITSNYDKLINMWFIDYLKKPSKKNTIKLKYGENPYQKSTFTINNTKNSLFKNKIHGKEIGYNNILDISAGLDCINEFKDPTSVIIKHGNPCGVASSKKNIKIAFVKSILSDPLSSYGGIIILNRTINKFLALEIIKGFYEIIVATSFSKDALSILKTKKNLILVQSKNIVHDNKIEIRSAAGGLLKQDKNNITISIKNLKCVSEIKATKKEINDMIFALKVCKHVKSNAIVLANNLQTVGIGAGQMSRLDATDIAIIKNKKMKNEKSYVAASDAFFPFIDNIKKLYNNNCSAVIQPMGSINDGKVISFSNKNSLPLYFSKFRFFKH